MGVFFTLPEWSAKEGSTVMVSLPSAIKLGFQHFFDFKGRATRAEYWWWILFVISCFQLTSVAGPLHNLFGIAIFIPSWTLIVRRLHDINKTGWWLLFGLVPVIGPVMLLVWTIKRGDREPNKYGPDPGLAIV